MLREDSSRHDSVSIIDCIVIILSPVIVAGLTVIYLAGWWMQAAWGWARGRE